MKKAFLLPIFALIITIACDAQDTRSFSASGFTKVSMGSAFRIDVKQGKQFSIHTSGRREDLEELEASVKGGTLHLGYRNNSWTKSRKQVNVSITMPSLEGVDFSGASKATVAPFSGVKSMDIEVSGASQVTMEVSAPKVTFDLSGASSLVLTGKGDVLDGEVSGASSFKGRDFSSKTANIEASGASSAHVMASNTVHADASGASSIRYAGDARDVHSNTSGASSVKRE
ncbi:head GIN domain-containing protein [Dyadobacter sandarakinus]|uniref:DUF2807 domain-containing protein n=1 Tax=Dyadobacter sandarakinus TaxID=2747268 RepID=A0ABX7I8Y1_9BACT|nr:head GIN domain-containing protein [Dyadobacter sandarakinus]QRR02384.1 DUF2807 domain-containing protein [Dyadobacter sandarakinus]